MRSGVPGLASAAPIGLRLPGVFQEDDDFLMRFVDALDETLAPVLATLDGLNAYVDPWLAPEDFLDWLAGWVGIPLDDAWTVPQRRAIVAAAALVHRMRGTARGVAEALRLAVDADVVLTDSGGSTWSATPDGQLPGQEPPSLHVQLVAQDPGAIDRRRMDAVVAAVKPAHVPHTIEIVQAGEGAAALSGGSD